MPRNRYPRLVHHLDAIQHNERSRELARVARQIRRGVALKPSAQTLSTADEQVTGQVTVLENAKSRRRARLGAKRDRKVTLAIATDT